MNGLLRFNSPLKSPNDTQLFAMEENRSNNDATMQFNREPFPSLPFNLSVFDNDIIHPVNESSQLWSLSASAKGTAATDKENSIIKEILQNENDTLDITNVHPKTTHNERNINDSSTKWDCMKYPRQSSLINWNVMEHDSDLASADILENVDFDQVNTLIKQVRSNNVEINKLERKYQTQPELHESKLQQFNTIKASCPVELCIPSTPNAVDYLCLEYEKSLSTPSASQLCEFTPPPEELSYLYQSPALVNESIGEVTKARTTYEPGVDVTLTPRSIQQLYEMIKSQYSDFAFVYALSAQLCQDRIPMDCFATLKMALLLSLSSISDKPDMPPIPLIAIGNDAYMINYLMMTVGQLASRFVGPCDDVKAPSLNSYRNSKWLEADGVLLAQGGIYYVGDWSRLKLTQSEHLFKTIECLKVTVEKTTVSYPLQTAIWSHWRCFNYNIKEQKIFCKFVKIFGVPIYVADDNHESLVNYTLEQTSTRLYESTIDKLSINNEELRSFLILISERTVDWTPEANDLLEKYFVSCRKARPDCLGQQAFVSLKQFAESFAKLSLRHEVMTNDVIGSIILCEHFIQHVFEANDNPPPHFGAINFVGIVDEYYEQFHDWLFNYIEKYYSV